VGRNSARKKTQIRPSPSQIQPNPAKPGQRKSKELPLFSLSESSLFNRLRGFPRPFFLSCADSALKAAIARRSRGLFALRSRFARRPPARKPLPFVIENPPNVSMSFKKASKDCKIASESFSFFPGFETYQWVTGEIDEKINDGGVDRRCSWGAGLFVVLFVFVSGSSGFFRQVKGWRRFDRGTLGRHLRRLGGRGA
jgi:hypothetical protein